MSNMDHEDYGDGSESIGVPDYSGEEAPQQEDAIKKLGRLAVHMAKLQLEEEEIAERMKQIKNEIRDYQENLLPAVMQELGAKDITTMGGMRIELREEIRASFPKDNEKRIAALDYLERTGNDGLLKREFRVRYGRDSAQWAEKFREILRANSVDEHAVVEDDWSIHHQSLLKFLRDEIAKGANVPLENFGAFVQLYARIKR